MHAFDTTPRPTRRTLARTRDPIVVVGTLLAFLLIGAVEASAAPGDNGQACDRTDVGQPGEPGRPPFCDDEPADDDPLDCDGAYSGAPFCSGPSEPTDDDPTVPGPGDEVGDPQDPIEAPVQDCLEDTDDPVCLPRCYDNGVEVDCPAWVTDPDAPSPDLADDLELIDARVIVRDVDDNGATTFVGAASTSVEELPRTGAGEALLGLLGATLLAAGAALLRRVRAGEDLG